MDSKFPTEYSISDRLYFNEFAIYKRTISANFVHPILKKTVCHKFHIATLEQYKNTQEFKERVKTFGFNIDKTDRTEELKLFQVALKNRQNYFFFEVLDSKKQLTLYYATMYTRDCFDDLSTNPKDTIWADYIKSCHDEIAGYILYDQAIHISCLYDLFNFFHEFGFDVFEWLNKESPEYVDEPLGIRWFNEWSRNFKKIKEPAMRNYALAVLQSVFQKEYQDHKIMQCQFCNRYIDYEKNKKFCSLNLEKRDCGKKARNKRHYQRNKEKIIPKAIRINKELRTLYKAKGIKK